jgi:ABC-type branched-subunit amino acid transport system ATPase component
MNTIPDGAVAAGGKPRRGATLRVEHLCKRFGGLEVFRDISFELPAGSVLGVIGPNGAGKTTLINVICGMLAPSSGRIMLGDQDISGLPFHTLSRQGVVRSFQQTNTFRSETVRENLLRSIQFSRGDTVGREEIQDLLVEFANWTASSTNAATTFLMGRSRCWDS